jgi:hypothetical protein
MRSSQIATPYVVVDEAARSITEAAIQAVVCQRGMSRSALSRRILGGLLLLNYFMLAFGIPYTITATSVDIAELLYDSSSSESSTPPLSAPEERQFMQWVMQEPARFRISRSDLRLVPGNPRILAQPI